MTNYLKMQNLHFNTYRKIHLSAHQHVRKLPVCRHFQRAPLTLRRVVSNYRWRLQSPHRVRDLVKDVSMGKVCKRRTWSEKRGSRRWATFPARYHNEPPPPSARQAEGVCVLQLFISAVCRYGCRGQQRYALIPRIMHPYDYDAHNHNALYRKIIAGCGTDTH